MQKSLEQFSSNSVLKKKNCKRQKCCSQQKGPWDEIYTKKINIGWRKILRPCTKFNTLLKRKMNTFYQDELKLLQEISEIVLNFFK